MLITSTKAMILIILSLVAALIARYSSSSTECRSSSAIPSNVPGLMYPKQIYFIVLLLLGGSQQHRCQIFSVTVSSNEAQRILI